MTKIVVSELNIARGHPKDRRAILEAVAEVNRGDVVWITEDGRRIAAIVSLAAAAQLEAL